MKITIFKSGITYREILIFLISSLAMVLLLFYVDEGYYSFDWIKEPFAIVVLLIYFVPAFLCQLLIHAILLKINIPVGRTVLSVIIGIILGITLVVSAFYLL